MHPDLMLEFPAGMGLAGASTYALMDKELNIRQTFRSGS